MPGTAALAGQSAPSPNPDRLEKGRLRWVDFKVMRRTNASLGQDAKVDPKVSADQRGHGKVLNRLEGAVSGRKVAPIREKVASRRPAWEIDGGLKIQTLASTAVEGERRQVP